MAQPGGTDLVSDQVFKNFELHLEFLLRPGANSGVFLRGLYEVQLFDHTSSEHPPTSRCGAIYGQIAPPRDVFSGPGRWNTLDMKLVGQRVTVIMNGERIIDNERVLGPTSKPQFIKFIIPEGKPGPVLLQCYHPSEMVKFRNIRIRPLK